MRKQIKELIEKATVTYYSGMGERDEVNLFEFADLIIEDILAIAENELHPQAYSQVLTKVQQHFYESQT